MIEKLNEYYDKGLITKQVNPRLPLIIWNYTPKVQIDKLWDDITLQCRGLVTDTDGNIVARPFKKFFNYGELDANEIPNEPCRFFEKVDGSLGIFFWYRDQWVFASRGSFTSDYAIKAKEIFANSVWDNPISPTTIEQLWRIDLPRFTTLSKEHTYLFEIIFPEGRIVVDYGNVEKLVLLGMIHTATGKETGYEDLVEIADSLNVDVIKEYHDIPIFGISTNDKNGFQNVKYTIKDNEEGRVVVFKNGFRMKIKGDEYVRLHYIITNFSSRKIWEICRTNGNLEDFLVDVPDEFYNWAKTTYNDLQGEFKKIKDQVEVEYWDLIDRKEYAEKIKDNKIKHLLFKRLTSYSTRLDDNIWDMLYPEYFNPFSNKIIDDEN